MFSLTSWLAGTLVITLASFLQSITGFGFALISVPLLLLVYDPHKAVGINMLLSFTSLCLLTVKVRHGRLKHIVRRLFLGSLLGIPFGIYVLLRFNVKSLKLIISVVTLVFSVLLLVRRAPHRSLPAWAQAAVGALSGFMTGSISMPGPPVILTLNQQELTKEQFRATTVSYFALVYPISFLLLVFLKALTMEMVVSAATLIPSVLLGQKLGLWIFPMVPQAQFRRGVPLLLAGISVYTVATIIL